MKESEVERVTLALMDGKQVWTRDEVDGLDVQVMASNLDVWPQRIKILPGDSRNIIFFLEPDPKESSAGE